MTITRSSNHPPPPDAPGISAEQVAESIDPAVKRAVAKLDEHQDAGRTEQVSLESYQQLHREFVDLTNRHVALERAVRSSTPVKDSELHKLLPENQPKRESVMPGAAASA